MLKKERQAYILHQVDLHNKVLSSDLSAEMNVSEDTIRRDLNELADQGRIMKVHGGALSKSFHYSIQSTPVYALEAKKAIARKAAEMVQDGMFVLTTGGTTIIEMARSLRPGLQATFITGSLPAAMEYMQHPSLEVILVGDKVSKSSQITVGGDAIQTIAGIRADLCFLGTNALDPEKGLTDNDWEVVQVKKAMIKSADQVVSLAIAEKLNTFQRLRVAAPEEIQVLITELDPSDPILEPYRHKGMKIV